MRDEQFHLHSKIEDSHWWFVARRRIIFNLVNSLLPSDKGGVIADVGCGTGANIGAFSKTHQCLGVDISETAIKLAEQRFPDVTFKVGSVQDPSISNSISQADCVLLLDVLEHIQDDFAFLSELLGAMKPGGYLVMTVPADLALWSPHDVYLDHFRRYDPERLQQVWSGLPVDVRLLSHFNARLYPFIKSVRSLSKLRGNTVGHSGTDLFQLPGWVSYFPREIMFSESNRLVEALNGKESRKFKAGVSLVAVLQRKEGAITVRHRPSSVPIDFNFDLTARQKEPTSIKPSVNWQRTIVVPCYNEAKRINLDEFASFMHENPQWNFLFVDDGSKDRTWEVLETLANREGSQAHAIRLSRNSGKAEAVRLGILTAINRGARIVGYWDADLATPLSEVNRLAKLLDTRPDCDLVLGSRVKLLGHQVKRSASRHFLGRAFATTASFVLGLPVYDTQCGAKLMRATYAIRNAFSEPFISKWIFDVEMIGRYIKSLPSTEAAADKIAEVPLAEWKDVKGSKLTPFSFVRAGFDLIRVSSSLSRQKKVHVDGQLNPVVDAIPTAPTDSTQHGKEREEYAVENLN